MKRDKRVRLSEEELNILKKYRDKNYDTSIPLGYVIGDALDE